MTDYSDPFGTIYIPPEAPPIPQVPSTPMPEPVPAPAITSLPIMPEPVPAPAIASLPEMPEPVPAPAIASLPEPTAAPFMVQSAGGSVVPTSSYNYTPVQVEEMAPYLAAPTIPGATSLVYAESALSGIDMRTEPTEPIQPVGFVDVSGAFQPWAPSAPAPVQVAEKQPTAIEPAATTKAETATQLGLTGANMSVVNGKPVIGGTFVAKGGADAVVEVPEATVKELQTKFGQTGKQLSLLSQSAPKINGDGTVSVSVQYGITDKAPAAVPTAVSLYENQLVSAGGKATVSSVFNAAGGASADPQDPGYYDSMVTSYKNTALQLTEVATYANQQKNAATDPADQAHWAKVASEATVGADTANAKAAQFANSNARDNLKIVQEGDATSLGLTSAERVADPSGAAAIERKLAAADTSTPAKAAAAVDLAQSEVDLLKARLNQIDPSQPGSWMWNKNGYGKTISIKPEIVLMGAGFGLSLYESLYARPQEADEQREYQLMLMDKQLAQQKELNQQMIDANMQIAQLEAETALAVADKEKSTGTPSSVNPGVHL